ncbi:MAG TPA: hypothetical protein VHS31_09505 [Tepidisphaeraceae bacterium]|jgi:hypothetical protein|nr:hypothetical protein [Tepidisphaeraceae bacterium]
MSVLRRGRIPALVISACALALSANASIRTTDSQDAKSGSPIVAPLITSSDELLGLNSGGHGTDVDWILRDDRQTLPANLSVLNADAAFNVSTAPSLYRTNTPIPVANTPHLNEPVVLVPVPVLNVGWAIILCSVLFSIGARVLRFRRPVRVRA